MSNSASHSYIQSHKHTIYIVSVTTSKVTSEHKLQIVLQILFIYNLFFFHILVCFEGNIIAARIMQKEHFFIEK